MLCVQSYAKPYIRVSLISESLISELFNISEPIGAVGAFKYGSYIRVSPISEDPITGENCICLKILIKFKFIASLL